jgi:ribosomal protein L7/L12
LKLSKEQKKEIERLIRSGDKLEAIKQLRNIGDIGLAEAKGVAEALETRMEGHIQAAHESGTPAPRNLKEAEQAALAALRDNNVMEAIKRYRKHTSLGLKESKDAVDALLVVHRSEGRINLKVAQALMTMIAEGRKDDALTHVMSHAGYDDAEARALIKNIAKMKPGAASCAGGCLRFVIALGLIGGVLWYVVTQSGLF